MAEKKKSQNKSKQPAAASTAKVTRITATDTRTSSSAKTKTAPKKKSTDSAPVKKVAPAKPTTASTTKTKAPEKSGAKFNPIRGLITYVKGAWYELQQVRWPNRRTTWSLTLAVLLFTAFFVALIVLLDFGFQWVFEQVLLG